MTLDEILREFEAQDIQRIKVGVFDLDGVLRGKYISRAKFESAAESGLGFCDVIFGWDIADVLYDGVPVSVTGWKTGYPDALARLDLDSFRIIPWEPGTALFLMDLAGRDGQPLPMAPRSLLRAVVESAARAGFEPWLASEFEFFIFKESPQSLKDKGYRGMSPLTPGMFGYSVLRASQNAPLVLDMLDSLNAFNIELEGLHTETGPGVYEAAIQVDTGLASADKAALFKTAVKEICFQHEACATFMAKWNPDLPGSGGHIHQSLWKDGRNIFHGGDQPASPALNSYIAGLVEHLPEITLMLCPTVNSYKRLVPGTWAPVNATWGFDNRTTAIRSIPGSKKSTRVEMRVCGADVNPYLGMAACLAAGLDGVKRNLQAPPPTENAYTTSAPALPRTLAEAVALFQASSFTRAAFGDAFVDHYAATREWEWRQFGRSVTDWELARYFEQI